VPGGTRQADAGRVFSEGDDAAQGDYAHEVEVIHPNATLEMASQKMTASNISALPVCDGEQLVGILTERDLIGRATAKTRNPQTATVSEVMTTDLLSCFED
jgi:CBS domain-containing protein